MSDAALLAAILDSLEAPVLFADTQHVVRYMNRAAIAHYDGGETLLGSSLLDCHNEQSQRMICDVLTVLRDGEEERLISESAEQRVYMRSVRGRQRQLLGYYERYERSAT